MATAQRTLRIGFLIDRWQPSRGGAERALAELASHLEARGHDVHAFGERGPLHGESAPGRFHTVHTRRFALSRGGRERRLAETMIAAADAAHCDVTIGVRHLSRVDLYWPHGGSHARSVAALRAARAWRADREAGIENVTLHGRHRAFVAFERALLAEGGARRVACVSRLVERELGEDFPAAKARLALVQNGVDLERFHPRERTTSGALLRRELGFDPRSVVIAFAARQPVLKGLPVLLEALARIASAPWSLVVAGSPDVAAWQRRARALKLGDERVRVLRDVDSAALFASASVCAAPTWRDTSGLVVLEALASGTPVVTTRCAGEAVSIQAESGTVIERPGDVDALAAALSAWIELAARGSIDREAVRASVASRGRAAWLAQLEALIVELAP